MVSRASKMIPTARGAFVVFEGCDRAGKTTQCKKLVEALNKNLIPAEYMNFPDRTTAIGQVIDMYLSRRLELTDRAVHLLFSANRWEIEPIIRRKLESGISLIVDRYSFSGVAFSAAKESMDMDWCWSPEIGLPKPDAVFLLNLNEEAISRRGGFGNERYEQTSFQKNVKNNFKVLQTASWKTIDADKDMEVLHSEILKQFLSVLQESKTAALEVFTENISK